ncbi:MAG: MaoC/PaaZ C-terminal domain-containing protein [Nevskiaceae bacterium]
MNLVLDRMPESGALALKALGSFRRKPRADVELPRMSVSLQSTRFDAERLRAYRAICGFPEGGAVPITYPQVHAIGLQMHLLSQPQFPLPLIGLVHLKNRIVQERELGADETFAASVGVIGHKATERGLEFELETTCAEASGRVVWTAVATVLHRGKQAARKKPSPPRQEDSRLADYEEVDAPADIGRRYGRIAGDMNPIHLYPLTARLLGFERHIAHGMWSLARSCALVQPHLGRAPRELTVQFRQPLFLPGRAALRYGPEGEGYAFALIGRDSGKTHLNGALR